jgi:imidazolonepropionase
VPCLLIHGARQVLTLRGPRSPRRGIELRNLSIVEDGSILIEDGRIRDVGPTRRIENLIDARSARQVSARGRVVMPGFVDCHLKLSGGASRVCNESDASAVHNIRQTPAARCAEVVAAILKWCLRYGTTTVEVKSGRGFDEASQLKILKILAELSKNQPVEVISSYCPSGLDTSRLSRNLAVTQEKKLARFLAVDCDEPSYDEPQIQRILDMAAAIGFPVKLLSSGAAAVALGLAAKAKTIEHLEGISALDMTRIGESETIAVLTPGHGFHRSSRGYAPARELIARGAALALASGYDRTLNPSFSMPITIELACRKLSMAPSEAIVAATLNAAYAVGRGATCGSIEPGKNADLIILETADFRDLAYETGVNPVDITIVRGEIACQNSVLYGKQISAS